MHRRSERYIAVRDREQVPRSLTVHSQRFKRQPQIVDHTGWTCQVKDVRRIGEAGACQVGRARCGDVRDAKKVNS